MENKTTYQALLTFKVALEHQLFQYKRIALENPELEPRIEDVIASKEA